MKLIYFKYIFNRYIQYIDVQVNTRYLEYPLDASLGDVTGDIEAATAAGTAAGLDRVVLNLLQNHVGHHFFPATALAMG